MAVRAPPGRWLLVDGCSAARKGYASQLVEHYHLRDGADRVDALVLSHPHRDHARGLADAVEALAPFGDTSRWPRLGMWPPPVAGRTGDSADPVEMFEGGITEQALAAIISRWEKVADSKWEMQVGDRMPLGDATLTVLSPEATVRRVAEADDFDWNCASTALSLRWKEVDIVLGSDLVESPGEGWSLIARRWSTIGRHGGLKIPHHGSEHALSAKLLSREHGPPDPAWVVAPFASKRLPRFKKRRGHRGAAELLAHVDRLYLTALPRKSVRQPEGSLTRMTLAEADAFTSDRDHDFAFPDGFVALEFDATGGTPRVSGGRGSVWLVS